ncbi:hypothetical protein EDB89DRAFT_1911822 [Lactarius sanguifluus]|nr:hypothetical protein EDB89DRAFT_1911822 [Lactarius sanguifluus]
MQRPPLWACGPLLPPLPPFPIPYTCAGHEAQDRTGQPPPLPLFTHNGERTPPLPPSRMRAKEARDRYAPPFVPVPVHVEQETRTPPPPPPLTRERGAAQEVTRHPRLHTTGTRQPPPPFVHARTGHANAGQAPAAAAAAPICAQGGVAHRNEVHGTGMSPASALPPPRLHTNRTRDGVGQGTRTPPFPLLPGTLRAMPEAARRPPRFARRGHAHEGSVRGDENGTAPHTLCAPPPFARTGRARTRARAPGWSAPPGSRARAMCEPERTEAAPSPRHRGKRAGRARWSQTRTGARTAAPPPPSPACSRARAKRERATTRKPPLSRGFARKGKTRAGDHAEAPPLPRVRAQGRNATAWRKRPLLCVCRGAQVGWCVTGRRANARRAVTWWHPTLGFAHRGSTCTCAAPVHKAEEPRLPGS